MKANIQRKRQNKKKYIISKDPSSNSSLNPENKCNTKSIHFDKKKKKKIENHPNKSQGKPFIHLFSITIRIRKNKNHLRHSSKKQKTKTPKMHYKKN